MQNVIGYDPAGSVWLVAWTYDPNAMPTDFNGLSLTGRVLGIPELAALHVAQAAANVGVHFDGQNFTPIGLGRVL